MEAGTVIETSFREELTTGFKEVTRADLFERVGKLNVHPYPQGNYPYYSDFKTQSGEVVARLFHEICWPYSPSMRCFVR